MVMATTDSSFNAETEAHEVIARFRDEVEGKTILITGVDPNGVGAALAKALASAKPALLILTARSLKSTQAVVYALAQAFPDVKTRQLELDPSSTTSIIATAAEVKGYPEPSIDIVFNNEGVMNVPRHHLNDSNFEKHLAVNYLGASLFTNSIMPKLLAGSGARIVMLSSNAYAFSPFRFSDPQFLNGDIGLAESEEPPKAALEQIGISWSREYVPAVAYAQSKTAGILYAVQLNKILASRGVFAVCVMPGAIAIDSWRYVPKEVREQHVAIPRGRMPSQAISTFLVAALDPLLPAVPTPYLQDCQPAELLEFAKDPDIAESLWRLTDKLLEGKFGW